jgi:hypothetical protein
VTLERLLVIVSRAFTVLFALTIAYAAVSLVIALLFRVGTSEWPFIVLILATLAVTAVYVALVIELRRRKRKLVTELSTEAAAWPESQAARAAAQTGARLTRVDGLRAHARGAHVVEVSWNPSLEAVDEVLLCRSASGFATSPELGDGQVVLCRSLETGHVESDLDDERVYFYSAFAHGHDGTWSAPSWAWAATPRLPLHTKLLTTLRLGRVMLFDG